jgi:hypothetical protein
MTGGTPHVDFIHNNCITPRESGIPFFGGETSGLGTSAYNKDKTS